jgi:hypothetical protein
LKVIHQRIGQAAHSVGHSFIRDCSDHRFGSRHLYPHHQYQFSELLHLKFDITPFLPFIPIHERRRALQMKYRRSALSTYQWFGRRCALSDVIRQNLLTCLLTLTRREAVPYPCCGKSSGAL